MQATALRGCRRVEEGLVHAVAAAAAVVGAGLEGHLASLVHLLLILLQLLLLFLELVLMVVGLREQWMVNEELVRSGHHGCEFTATDTHHSRGDRVVRARRLRAGAMRARC